MENSLLIYIFWNMDLSYEKDLGNLIYEFLLSVGLSENIALVFKALSLFILIGALLIALDYVIRITLRRTAKNLVQSTKTDLDDLLLEHKVPMKIGHVLPAFLFKGSLPFILGDFPGLVDGVDKVFEVYLVFLFSSIAHAVLSSFKKHFRKFESLKDKPIDSIAQVLSTMVYVVAFLITISVLADQSISQLLTTLGAASAILLLIFRDSLLGFTSSLQLTYNDLVRVGDWISVPKYGADGNVEEIGVTTVKVQNFDNTISNVPTYALISDSFQNWRGMTDSPGRRIKRSMLIKQNSIRFLTADDIERFSKIELIQNYVVSRSKSIEAHNKEHNVDKSELINGRNLTNIGLFRKYMIDYVDRNPAISKDLTLMARQLQPTEHGLPIEIYCFSKDKVWVNYEYIMSDLFDHFLAAVPYFDLELHESPTGNDIKSLKGN